MSLQFQVYNIVGWYLEIQFSCLVMSNSLWPQGLQHARPPCPSPSPGVCPSSCSLHWWCCPVISSSDSFFSLCPQSFPASGTFPMSRLLPQITKILELQRQRQSFQWIFRVDLPQDWLVCSPCCPRDFEEPSPTTVWKHLFFGILSLWCSSHNCMWPLGRPQPWLYGPLLTE